MDEREQETTAQDEAGYEPPEAQDVDTEVTPVATASGAQTQIP